MFLRARIFRFDDLRILPYQCIRAHPAISQASAGALTTRLDRPCRELGRAKRVRIPDVELGWGGGGKMLGAVILQTSEQLRKGLTDGNEEQHF